MINSLRNLIYFSVLLLLGLTFNEYGFAQNDKASNTYSLQWQALAPNAGGQDAFGLKIGDDTREWGFFSNQYLFASGFPLSGITYDWRFPLCDRSCWNPVFLQLGTGISQVGPLAQVTWSFTLLRTLRLDYTTQAYLGNTRFILWSYPLWLGVSFRF